MLSNNLKLTIDYKQRVVKLPKHEMVSLLLGAVDSNRLHLPADSKHLDAMKREMEAYEVHVSDSGRETLAARTDEFDDLLCSLGYACFLGSKHGRPLLVW